MNLLSADAIHRYCAGFLVGLAIAFGGIMIGVDVQKHRAADIEQALCICRQALLGNNPNDWSGCR